MTDTADQLQATVDKRVQQYIQVRNKLKQLDAEAEAKRAPLVEIQNMLSGWMQAFLTKFNAKSVKTAHGTCYQSTHYTASLADPEAFMNFVVANQQFDLLDRKANATACRDYVAEHKTLPPGVNISAIKTVGVRAPTK
jgi:hypothetical protein